jgi:hypothetical protein
MKDTIQQILVGVAVLAAVIYLMLRMRSKKGGKSGCGCVPKKPLK